MGVVGNNSEIILGWIPLEFHGIWSYKTSRTSNSFSFFVPTISPGVPKEITCLFTSPNNKFCDQSNQNRLKKLVPRAHFSKQVSENHLRKSTKHFSKPEFWVKFGFPKTRVSSPATPQGVYISRKWPQTNIFSKKDEKHAFVVKWLPFLMFFLFIPY